MAKLGKSLLRNISNEEIEYHGTPYMDDEKVAKAGMSLLRRNISDDGIKSVADSLTQQSEDKLPYEELTQSFEKLSLLLL